MADEIVICPFDKNHKVANLRFKFHFVKCREKHPDIPIYICSYSANHIFTSSDALKAHILNCPNLRLLETKQVLDCKRHVGGHIPALPKDPNIPCSEDEDWGEPFDNACEDFCPMPRLEEAEFDSEDDSNSEPELTYSICRGTNKLIANRKPGGLQRRKWQWSRVKDNDGCEMDSNDTEVGEVPKWRISSVNKFENESCFSDNITFADLSKQRLEYVKKVTDDNKKCEVNFGEESNETTASTVLTAAWERQWSRVKDNDGCEMDSNDTEVGEVPKWRISSVNKFENESCFSDNITFADLSKQRLEYVKKVTDDNKKCEVNFGEESNETTASTVLTAAWERQFSDADVDDDDDASCDSDGKAPPLRKQSSNNEKHKKMQGIGRGYRGNYPMRNQIKRDSCHGNTNTTCSRYLQRSEYTADSNEIHHHKENIVFRVGAGPNGVIKILDKVHSSAAVSTDRIPCVIGRGFCRRNDHPCRLAAERNPSYGNSSTSDSSYLQMCGWRTSLDEKQNDTLPASTVPYSIKVLDGNSNDGIVSTSKKHYRTVSERRIPCGVGRGLYTSE